MQIPPPERHSLPAHLKLDYPAKVIALNAAPDAIAQVCNARKIGKSLVSRARIVVEELFSNTIK